MTEIQDTFRDAEIETPKASSEERYGEGHHPLHPTRGSGERDPGQSPAENALDAF